MSVPRIRQLVLAARDLEARAQEFHQVFGMEVSFRDPGLVHFGLQNVVMTVGDTFLEIINPISDDLSQSAGGRFLMRNGDGGYMVIIQVASIEATRSLIERAECQIIWDASGQVDEVNASGKGLHVHPRDAGTILSLDQMTPESEWVWADANWQRHSHSGLGVGLCGCTMVSANAETIARHWGHMLDTEVHPDANGWLLNLNETLCRFQPGDNAEPRLSCYDLAVSDTQEVLSRAMAAGLPHDESSVDLCGMRFALRTA